MEYEVLGEEVDHTCLDDSDDTDTVRRYVADENISTTTTPLLQTTE